MEAACCLSDDPDTITLLTRSPTSQAARYFMNATYWYYSTVCVLYFVQYLENLSSSTPAKNCINPSTCTQGRFVANSKSVVSVSAKSGSWTSGCSKTCRNAPPVAYK